MNGKMKIIIAMLIYGSIGVFVKNIDLTAIQIAFLRASVGSAFLILVGLGTRKNLLGQIKKKSMRIFFLSGALLGINWFFLFKAFEYTSVSTAVLVYYFAPIIVILLSPLVLGEKLSAYKLLCMAAAVVGLSMVVLNSSSSMVLAGQHFAGIGYALLAAVFYASVILINKKFEGADELGVTLIQLIASAGALLPIMFIGGGLSNLHISGWSLLMIIILGVVHTGVAYMLYFSSMKVLDAQTVAIYCYIDPISAVIFAWMFLGEYMNFVQAVGGVLILGATYFVDYEGRPVRSAKQF